MSKLKSKQDQLLKTHREQKLKQEETFFKFSISEGPFSSSGRTGSANSTSHTPVFQTCKNPISARNRAWRQRSLSRRCLPRQPFARPCCNHHQPRPKSSLQTGRDPTEIHSQPNLGSDSNQNQQLFKLTDLIPPGLTVQAPGAA